MTWKTDIADRGAATNPRAEKELRKRSRWACWPGLRSRPHGESTPQAHFCCSVTEAYLTLQPHGLQHTRLLVLHYFPEFAQIHVHWVDDAIQPSHPLSSPSPPALNLSQDQSLFQWVGSCITGWPKRSRYLCGFPCWKWSSGKCPTRGIPLKLLEQLLFSELTGSLLTAAGWVGRAWWGAQRSPPAPPADRSQPCTRWWRSRAPLCWYRADEEG